jgi:hypothetical protein
VGRNMAVSMVNESNKFIGDLYMLYMVIEIYRNDSAKQVYERFKEKGRMLPDGLKYIDSWVETNLSKCYQLMETDDETLFAKWVENWEDIVEFEIFPVMTSKEASERTT